MNNFDDIYQNIEENFLAWIDEFQERGSRLPIAIYADFEATYLKIQTVQPSNEASYNQNISKQEVNRFGIYIRSDYKNLISLLRLYWN